MSFDRYANAKTQIEHLCDRMTVGSAAGSIRELFAKIKAIDAKHGKFDLVLCTGDFFGLPNDEGEEYKDDDDVMQLLSGALEGMCPCTTLFSRLHLR